MRLIFTAPPTIVATARPVTRYDQKATNFLAFVKVAPIMVMLK